MALLLLFIVIVLLHRKNYPLNKMKEIYIVLTHTGSMLSRSIKLYKHSKFSHVSIGFDSELNLLYSFGRIYPYNPFLGSLVSEGINIGTFKRFKKTRCKIMKFTVTEEQYQLMLNKVTAMMTEKEKYKFNIRGLFFAAFNKTFQRPYRYYCSQFVKFILETGNIDLANLPEVVQPESFLLLNNLKIVYEGLLKHYPENSI